MLDGPDVGQRILWKTTHIMRGFAALLPGIRATNRNFRLIARHARRRAARVSSGIPFAASRAHPQSLRRQLRLLAAKSMMQMTL
jgi:hypothetical protein